MKKIDKRKKALSSIISIFLIILLVFIVAGIIWEVVNNLITDKTKKSKACFNSIGKIEINSFYTCYNKTGDELKFGIERKDFDLDSILVVIATDKDSYSLKIPAKQKTESLEELTNFSRGKSIITPPKNSGYSYYLNLSKTKLSGSKPIKIQIAPIVNDFQCDVSDSLDIIEDC